MNDAPKMTPEEADARFAALVAEYRGQKKAKGKARPDATVPPDIASSSVRSPEPRASWSSVPFVLSAVYVAGVAAGAVGHAHPFTPILVGVPLLLIGRALFLRWSRDGRHHASH